MKKSKRLTGHWKPCRLKSHPQMPTRRWLIQRPPLTQTQILLGTRTAWSALQWSWCPLKSSNSVWWSILTSSSTKDACSGLEGPAGLEVSQWSKRQQGGERLMNTVVQGGAKCLMNTVACAVCATRSQSFMQQCCGPSTQSVMQCHGPSCFFSCCLQPKKI